MSSLLICPLCKSRLVKEVHCYKCTNNHTYDIAKEGYTNLLLINQKSSLDPGDDKSMVDSRRAFLDQGFYHSTVESIAHVILARTASNGASQDAVKLRILDSGCGEGYYLDALRRLLSVKVPELETYGFDISKYAIQLASKKYRESTFFVSNINYDFPFADTSFDFVLNIFSPRNSAEFFRILKADGRLIVVYPAVNHINRLRSVLKYGITYEEKTSDILANLSQCFDLEQTLKVEHTVDLSAKDVNNLAKMSPIFWQIDQTLLESLPPLDQETFSFNISVFKKK